MVRKCLEVSFGLNGNTSNSIIIEVNALWVLLGNSWNTWSTGCDGDVGVGVNDEFLLSLYFLFLEILAGNFN